MIRPPQRSTLFPYTTLFRSHVRREWLAHRGILRAPAAFGRELHIDGKPLSLRRGVPAAGAAAGGSVLERAGGGRSEEHTSELQSQFHLVCRLLLEKKNRPKSCSAPCRAARSARRRRSRSARGPPRRTGSSPRRCSPARRPGRRPSPPRLPWPAPPP